MPFCYMGIKGLAETYKCIELMETSLTKGSVIAYGFMANQALEKVGLLALRMCPTTFTLNTQINGGVVMLPNP